MTWAMNTLVIYILGRDPAAKLIRKGMRLMSTSVTRYTTKSQKSPMSLPKQLQARIDVRGPLSVADYMRAVLTSPSGGYYMHRDVLGRQGDFTTSPEISQLFGDMVGIWYVNEVNKFYAPKQPLQLVELGPGRGSLTADVLKVFRQLRGNEGLSVHLVEVSPEFSRIQAEKLCKKDSIQSWNAQVPDNKSKLNGRQYELGRGNVEKNSAARKGSSFNTVTVQRPHNLPKKSDAKHYQQGEMEDGTPVFWYYSLNEVPHKFSCFLAHEFFDALPIHKFKKTPEGWREILITADTDSDNFRYVISRSGTPASKVFMKPWDEREEAEICPDAGLIAQQISSRLEGNGGVALIIDYGYDGETHDTFRAFRQHKQVDPLVSPGSADLTADVDFTYLRNAVSDKALTFGPVSQSFFLRQMGIDIRLKVLLEECSEDQKSLLQSGYNMIMDSMGERFKFFAFFPSVLKDHLKKFPVSGFPNP